MPGSKAALNETGLAFETRELRDGLRSFYDSDFVDNETDHAGKIGDIKWGVYAFFDYDGEPIYVGQTYEKLRARIGRHLTNQRTDAVAMSVLDPFEVLDIEVWPLPGFQNLNPRKNTPEVSQAKKHLDALEFIIFKKAVSESEFKAVLNEKNPRKGTIEIAAPRSFRKCVVSNDVVRLRGHPDMRIARRALTISRLAQVISERQVQGGLRRVLAVQAQRLEHLARRRYEALGGGALVETEDDAYSTGGGEA